MTIRNIRIFGDPVLTTRATEVTEFDAGLKNLVDDMFETMKDAGGVGLAANQIGVLKRVFVFDCTQAEDGLGRRIAGWVAVIIETGIHKRLTAL